jgi:TPR repeat protein
LEISIDNIFLSQPDCQSQKIKDVMDILRKHKGDKEKMIQVAELLRKVADEGNIEACLRMVACYFQRIGVEKNKEKMIHYSKKAMEGGSLDGAFFLSMTYKKEEMLPYLDKPAQMNHSASKWWKGYLLVNGIGIASNKEVGQKLMYSVAISGDAYWSDIHACILEQKACQFEYNEDEVKFFKSLSSRQVLSDLSLFDPVKLSSAIPSSSS